MSGSLVDSAVRGVAAYGLPGGAPLPRDPILPADWAAVVDAVRAHRIVGLLMRAVRDGSFAVDQRQRGQAAALFRQARVYTIALQSHLLHIADLLERAVVDYRVLKGASLAALAYPDQAVRPYGDVDILVRPAQFEGTVELLEGAGYRRALGWHRVGRAHDKGTVLLADEGYAIDLHYALAHGPYRWLVPSADLFAEPQTFSFGARLLPALPPPEQFLHACLHARIGNIPPRLLSVRDVAQCALRADLNWGAVERLCDTWQVTAVVSDAIRTAQDILGMSLGDSARSLASYQPSMRELRLLKAYESAKENHAALSLATLAVRPGLVRKADYAYNLLLPGKQYMLGHRYRSHRARWRHLRGKVAELLMSRLRQRLR